MSNLLDQIVKRKRAYVESCRRERSLASLQNARQAPFRDFSAALRKPGVSAIAEIKRRSPSKGWLFEKLDPEELAPQYASGGASALSVLTDQHHFAGSDDDLIQARRSVHLPVLRKDFVIDEYQVHEACALGADAILLIVRVLDEATLCGMLSLSASLGMSALVETHSEEEVKIAVGCGATIIGVNCRDLETFDISLDLAIALRSAIPRQCVAVAESGIQTVGDVRRIRGSGFDAMLIGEALVKSEHPGDTLADLLKGAT